jgi:hypothetical protein
MKRLILSFLLLLFFSSSYAQQGLCGTVLSASQEAWLKHFVQSEMGKATKSGKSVTRYIPLKAHIIGDDNGNGYYPMSTLLQVICELNAKYVPVNFVFYLYGDVNYINNTAFYVDGSSLAADNAMIQNNIPDVLNVYFVQASPGLCGYYSPSLDCVVIIGGCGQPGNTTIAHELGHFFSLPHTFFGWENNTTPPVNQQERVNGSNCSTTADNFCDTPADYISVRWNCPYTGTKLDANGTPYNPDPTLFMSYSSDACQNRFSLQQIAAMQADATSRNVMINHTPPTNFNAITAAPSNCSPTGFSSTLLPGNATFTWHKPANADLTYLQLRKYGLGSFVADIVTADSFYTFTNLEYQTAYQWKVKCFNAANTCGTATSYSAFNYFITADLPLNITNSAGQMASIELLQNPIPNGNNAMLHFGNTTKDEKYAYDLVQLNGQTLLSQSFEKTADKSNYTLETNSLQPGIYIIKLTCSSTQIVKKIIIN